MSDDVPRTSPSAVPPLYQHSFDTTVDALKFNKWSVQQAKFQFNGWSVALAFHKGWIAVHVRIMFDAPTSTLTVTRRRGFQFQRTIYSVMITNDQQVAQLAIDIPEVVRRAILPDGPPAANK